jgi:hypothetical protein
MAYSFSKLSWQINIFYYEELKIIDACEYMNVWSEGGRKRGRERHKDRERYRLREVSN